MKSVYSSTGDSKYDFFIPIVSWCWNKLGIGSIVFVPEEKTETLGFAMSFASDMVDNISYYAVSSPKHKEATYLQCSRLYAACNEDLPEDEVIVTSDVDMACFGNIFKELNDGKIHLIGADLLEESMKQIPMCYISMRVDQWRQAMGIGKRGYQECLDMAVGSIECEDFRGNQWSLDQNIAYNRIRFYEPVIEHSRAKMPERFAINRIDRDDSFWQERLNKQVIDAHLWRPGYIDENIEKILHLLKFMYPEDHFDWLIYYTEQYKKLL